MTLLTVSLLLVTSLALTQGVKTVVRPEVSDRQLIQLLAVKPFAPIIVPPVAITLTGNILPAPVSISLSANLTVLQEILFRSPSVVVFLEGFLVTSDLYGVKVLNHQLMDTGATVVSIRVLEDNLVTLVRAVPALAKTLKPLFEILPFHKTKIVAAEAGVHLGGAVFGLLPQLVQVQQVIGLDPNTPLLEKQTFLKFYGGRAPSLIFMHTTAGAYKPSVQIYTVLVPGLTTIYVHPDDLTPLCGMGPVSYVCKKGVALKLMLDALLGRLILVKCTNMDALIFFQPQRCIGTDAQILNLNAPPVPGIYYAVIAALAKEKAVHGLLGNVLGIVEGLLDKVLSIKLPASAAIVNLLRDVLYIPVTTSLGFVLYEEIRVVPGSLEILPIIDVVGGIIGGNGQTINDLLGVVGELLNNLLGVVGDVVGGVVEDLGKLVGGLLGGLGLSLLGGPLKEFLAGLGSSVEGLAEKLGQILADIL